MKKQVNLNGRIIEYNLIRKKVKNLNLRIKADCTVNVSANSHVKIEYIEKFLTLHADYIIMALDKYEKRKNNKGIPEKYESGEYVWILGKPIKIHIENDEKNFVRLKKDLIVIHVRDTENFELKRKTLDKFLKEVCRNNVERICTELYPIFEKQGISYPSIKFRSMVSRWGSCNPKEGKLTFNYALVHVSYKCIEYVVIHEFTHFFHANHSKQFYSKLSSLLPDWKQRQDDLKNSVNIRR